MLQFKKITDKIKGIRWQFYLFLIIVFALMRLVYLFSLRDGHHVDETWSYGYANSYYLPHVFGGYSEDTEKNIGEWITGDVFKDYITVDGDHRFAFDSVLYNKKDDLSPILYAFILHFICSLFPGEFSWTFAFFISVLFYIPTLILFFVLTKEITDSELCGYISVIYYVFSGCGTANFLFLRVYHIFTFLTLLLFFFMHRILINPEKKIWLNGLFLFVSCLLGCLTHYYFLIMAFGLTLFSCLVLLFRKRIKDAFSVGLIMLLSVVTFFLVYSPALAKILPYSSGTASGGTTGYHHYPYYFNLYIANVRFFFGTIGFYIPFTLANFMYFLGIVLFAAITVLLFRLLFRNEEWMKNTVNRTKSAVISFAKAVACFCSEFKISVLVALLSSVFFMLVIPFSATLVNMGFVERYFFPGMALFLVFYLSFIGKFMIRIIPSIKIKALAITLSLIMASLLVFLNIRSYLIAYPFEFRDWNEKEMLSELKDKDVYVVIKSERDMVFLSSVLYQSDDIYVDYQKSFDEDDFSVPDLDPDCLLMVIDNGLMTEEQKSEFLESDSFTIAGYLKPEVFMTLNDIVGKVSDHNGNTYEKVGAYTCFVGDVYIFRANGS